MGSFVALAVENSVAGAPQGFNAEKPCEESCNGDICRDARRAPKSIRRDVIRGKRNVRPGESTVHSFYEFFAGAGMARAGLGEQWNCVFANEFDLKKTESYKKYWPTS